MILLRVPSGFGYINPEVPEEKHNLRFPLLPSSSCNNRNMADTSP